jgi:hypothetical protein
MASWVGQERDSEYLASLKALDEQARLVNTILIVILVFVGIVVAGFVTGVGT